MCLLTWNYVRWFFVVSALQKNRTTTQPSLGYSSGVLGPCSWPSEIRLRPVNSGRRTQASQVKATTTRFESLSMVYASAGAADLTADNNELGPGGGKQNTEINGLFHRHINTIFTLELPTVSQWRGLGGEGRISWSLYEGRYSSGALVTGRLPFREKIMFTDEPNKFYRV